MSSNPPTEGARWRRPATWSLRTRLVAIMISLLALLGLAVGTTAELAMHRVLFKRIDIQLNDAAALNVGRFGAERSTLGATRPGPPPSRVDGQPGPGDEPPALGPGQLANTLTARLDDGTVTSGYVFRITGGEVTPVALPASANAILTTIRPDGLPRTYTFGDLGEYRVIARPVFRHPSATVVSDPDVIVVTGLPLAETRQTLGFVADVVTAVTLIALLVAGAAGAVIVRRTLRPLSRVAGTATRVAQLRLDRGEVVLPERVPEADTDPRTEVGAVGAALNQMLDHVHDALTARQASETRVRQFVADASHELRTPLAAIRGYAELSRRSRTPVPDDVAHVLRRVESEAQRMTTLVEDLLLLARLDAGRPLARADVDLTMLLVDAVSDAHAAGPRHDWRLDLPDDPVVAVGDPARLHQVLANLLANARTHTPEGTVVTASVAVAGGQAELHVVDAGPGIPADLLPHVFERFARGDSSRSRTAGSTGLGLSIVHAVVTAHGGTVAVTSVPGRTDVTVRLPLAPASPPPASPPPASPPPASPSPASPPPASSPPASPPPADVGHQHVAQVVQEGNGGLPVGDRNL